MTLDLFDFGPIRSICLLVPSPALAVRWCLHLLGKWSWLGLSLSHTRAATHRRVKAVSTVLAAPALPQTRYWRIAAYRHRMSRLKCLLQSESGSEKAGHHCRRPRYSGACANDERHSSTRLVIQLANLKGLDPLSLQPRRGSAELKPCGPRLERQRANDRVEGKYDYFNE